MILGVVMVAVMFIIILILINVFIHHKYVLLESAGCVCVFNYKNIVSVSVWNNWEIEIITIINNQ